MSGANILSVTVRSLKWVTLFVVALGLVLFFFLWVLFSGVGETTVYSERNLWDYPSLTQEAIAQAPRITANYHFEFHNGDGYPSTNSIIFEGTRNVEALRAYLKSLGYQRDTRPGYGAEAWIKPDAPRADTFSINYDAKNKQVTLTQTLISW